MALIIVAAVAGFYIYARFQIRLAIRNLPAKVGIDVQQSSEGFSFSKSEGGRTLFTIRASKATQFRQGGRAELHDVNIIVYGRNSDRFDQIYGKEFQYDPEAGTVVAKGEVNIDLAGNSEGQKLEDQATPHLGREPIHLRTEGLTFNQKTGLAETEGVIDLHMPRVSGTARGATYDSKKNELTLHSAIDVRTEGVQPTRIQAARGEIMKQPRVLTMDSVHMTSRDRTLLADHAIVNLNEGNAVEHVDATGNVRISDSGGIQVRSPRADLNLGPNNVVKSALFAGGVDFVSAKQGASGHSGELLVSFAPSGNIGVKGSSATQVQTIYAYRGATLHREAQKMGKNPQAFTITSNAMTFAVDAGRLLKSAQTDGPGQVVMSAAAPKNAGEQTVVDAQRLTAEFGEQNQLRTVHGIGSVRVLSRVPGQPDKLSTSDSMVTQLTPAGEISSVVQEGNFRYNEGQSSKSEPGGRSSFAARASYSPQDDSLTLQGNPRIVSGGMTVTAEIIRLLRRSGQLFAQGNVKTTYSELKLQPSGALLATADPIHVTAHAMNAKQLSGLAHYSGDARLWQGSNIVEAQTIDFDHKARTIVAQGDRKHPVSSVFLQGDGKGKASTMVVTAPRLNYVDGERQARYSGGVTARGQDGFLTADHADIFLNAAGTSRIGEPSQLDHIIASTHVVVQQQERRAVGDRLVYTAATGTYVMTGSPILSDPVNGTVRGDSLTFYSHDDRVVVESKGFSRTVTHTHVSR